ncbi:MAG: SPFH domain-containing protein [Phycisphaerae bacterium]|nr:SPFH domain-containing protein [Phycisphaerae bacterium]
MNRVPFPTLLTGLLLVGALAFYAFTAQVRFNQVAVRVQLGKASPESVIKEPGLYFRWPPPIEIVKVYDARLRTTDTAEAETKTVDGKNLIVSAYALWRIKEPHQYYIRVVEDAEAVKQLRTRLGQVRSAAVGKRELGFFANLENEIVQRNWEQLEQEMLAEAAPGILRDYGIELVKVGVRRISLPEQVTKTVFQAMIQNAKKLATQYQTEGNSQAAAIKARAEADKRQILAFAETKAQELRSRGIQRSTQILSQIESSNREFYAFLRVLDALRTSLSQRSTIFLDSSSPLYKTLVDPLDGSSANDLAQPKARSAVSPAPTALAGGRSEN